MPLTQTTLLTQSGAGTGTGSKAYLGRLPTWLFQVEVTRATADLQLKFQATTDDPDDVGAKWTDIESTARDTMTTATTLTFAATGTYEVEVKTFGTRAVRPVGIAAGVGDVIVVKCALPVAGV